MKTDIEIAREAEPKTIDKIADQLGIGEEYLERYGKFKSKVDLSINDEKLKDSKNGKLILVTAISPTPAGEGKTTTSVGLVDGLCHIGKNAMICLREPSLGPCFGMKGGAAGGGHAQVIPMTDINLHFTGDFHAIGAAHNLLSALIDNHIHWDNQLDIDPRRITWKRVVDMNDRSLRDITCGLGGVGNGIPRQSGYDITVASEIMAVLCLASDIDDLKNTFLQFANSVPFYGTVCACKDSKNVASILSKIDKPLITYGIDSQDIDIKAENLHQENGNISFDVRAKGQKFSINLSIPGITIFKPEVASRLYLPNLSIKPISNGLKILNILKATNTKRPKSRTLLTSEKMNSIVLVYY